uniref:Uncharacterized protein n=1 Tax=Cacopsylla melanoneura TaxID=428564 RepID=A0A8D8R319_9HEMI
MGPTLHGTYLAGGRGIEFTSRVMEVISHLSLKDCSIIPAGRNINLKIYFLLKGIFKYLNKTNIWRTFWLYRLIKKIKISTTSMDNLLLISVLRAKILPKSFG